MKRLALIFAITSVLYSCTTPEPSALDSKETATEVSFQNIEGELQLNDGAKWEANKETTAGVNNMIDQIVGFNNLEVPDEISSYNLLGRGIKHSMDEVFNKCTMKGAAHDELHDFLIPILGYNKTLNGEDLEAAKAALGKLENHLQVYSDFFE